MPVTDDSGADKPGLDAILQKVLEAVPFQLTTDGGPEAARQRFRDLPRRPVHQELRVEDRTIDGPAARCRSGCTGHPRPTTDPYRW